MASVVRQISKRIRHLPGIENWNGLWDVVRGPYQRFLNVSGGVQITVSDSVEIRIPAEYSGHDWENYEPETTRLAADWARNSHQGLFLDIGSAMGIFSAVVLFANLDTEVIAFDSDLASLVATHRFCKYAKGKLRTIHGFVTNVGSGDTLSEAEARSELALVQDNPSGDVGTTQYICLSSSADDDGNIPRNALDDLLRDEELRARPILIKCDVEGAELFVLHGARDTLARYHPSLLLSVHPPALPQYGHTKEGVSNFLRELGYKITVVATDHEEHWWCS